MKNKLIVLCILIIFSLLAGCSEKKINTNKIDASSSIENDNSEKFDQVFIDNEYCVIKTNKNKVDIVDKNAEFPVSIENKSNKDIEVRLNKINIGKLVREVEFEYKIKPNETKEGILKIKNISQLDTLIDKMEGKFVINSDEYYFIFKW
ncbi:hypothetical protein [Terrisporobacter sp.]